MVGTCVVRLENVAVLAISQHLLKNLLKRNVRSWLASPIRITLTLPANKRLMEEALNC
jgi:hypothetical protein